MDAQVVAHTYKQLEHDGLVSIARADEAPLGVLKDSKSVRSLVNFP